MSVSSDRLTVTEAPGRLPVSLEEMRLHLRLDHDADDALITNLIDTATALCESVTGLALIHRRYTLSLDTWPTRDRQGWWDGVREGTHSRNPAPLTLPKAPLYAVHEIRTLNNNDDRTVIPNTGYVSDTMGLPGRLLLKEGTAVPTPQKQIGGIEIDFTAGYGTKEDDVPAALRQGIKQIAAHLYENRGDTATQAMNASGALALFQPFRLMRIA